MAIPHPHQKFSECGGNPSFLGWSTPVCTVTIVFCKEHHCWLNPLHAEVRDGDGRPARIVNGCPLLSPQAVLHHSAGIARLDGVGDDDVDNVFISSCDCCTYEIMFNREGYKKLAK